MTVLVGASLAGLLVISVWRFVRHRNIRSLIFQLTLIAICSGVLYLLFWVPDIPVGKRDESREIYFVIVLFIFMILGMFANYAYSRFSKPKSEREKFDLGLFFAPVFTSPIVFLHLLEAMQNADVDLQNLTKTKIMVFCVAFENGFLWKGFVKLWRLSKAGKAGCVSVPFRLLLP